MFDIKQAHDVLLGVLYGDCLGAPYEFHYPNPLEKLSIGPSVFGHKPGVGTDDTETTVAVAKGLLDAAQNQADPILYVADRLADWYDTRPLDVGGTTGTGLRNYIATGVPMGCIDRGSQANGSLMRSAPFAFMRNGADYAVASSAITHAHPIVLMYVRAYVEMLQTLLRGEKYPSTLQFADPAKIPGSGGYVGLAFHLSIWAATEASSFEQGMEDIIRLGGDTDTNGAICGAALAARFGFPQELTEQLDYTRQMELAQLAKGLSDLT